MRKKMRLSSTSSWKFEMVTENVTFAAAASEETNSWLRNGPDIIVPWGSSLDQALNWHSQSLNTGRTAVGENCTPEIIEASDKIGNLI